MNRPPEDRATVRLRTGWLRWLLLGLAVLGGLVVAACAVLAVLLVRGPLSLEFLNRRLEAALSAPDGSLRVEIGTTELLWAGRGAGIDLRASDLRALAQDGSTIAAIPALSLRLSLARLVRGEIVLSHVRLLEPFVRVILEENGRLDLGLGEQARPTADNPLAGLVANDLTAQRSGASPGAGLERVDIERARLVLEDRMNGLVWQAPALGLSLHRESGGAVLAALDAKLGLGERVVSLSAHARIVPEPPSARLDLDLRGLDLAGFAAELTRHAESAIMQQHGELVGVLAGMQVPLDGAIHAELDGSWTPRNVRLELTGGKGSLLLPLLLDHEIPTAGSTITAQLDVAARRLEIARLSLDLGGPRLETHGSVSEAAGTQALDAEATIEDLPVAALATLWPESAARAARNWIGANISQGRIARAAVRLRGERPGSDGAPAPASGEAPPAVPAAAAASDATARAFRLDALDGSVAFDGLQVRYLPDLPPVTGVKGSATFSASDWQFDVAGADLGAVTIGGAKVAIHGLDEDTPRITIEAPVSGPLGELLGVLDREPFGFARSFGVDPATVTGRIAGRLQLDFPLGEKVDLGNAGLVASARIEDAGLPRLIEGHPIDAGNFDLWVDGSGLDLSGSARLAGIPVNLKWDERFAPQAGPLRSVKLDGTFAAAERRAVGFDLLPWLDGPIGASVVLTQPSAGLAQAELAFNLADARIELPQIGVHKAPGTPGRAQAHLSFKRGVVTTVDQFTIETAGCNVQGHAARHRGRWSTIEASGTLGEVQPGKGKPGSFDLKVSPGKEVEDFHLTSDDVSALLRSMGLFARGYGGQLDLSGSVDVLRPEHPFSSQLVVTHFTLTEAPALARVIQLASLPGIVESLSRSGIPINRLTTRIAGDVKSIEVSEAVVDASSFALALDGKIDRVHNTCAMQGTVVPDYYGLNPVLARIPLLGRLLGGHTGKGLLGVDFSINGPLANPEVKVQPIKSITPDVLQRLTRALGRPLTGRRAGDR